LFKKFVHLKLITRNVEDFYRMKLRTVASLILMIAALLFFSAESVNAQDEGALLPDIDPQDIEIRGEFSARFPGLSRQPILGFDPNLQVYQIDPNRKPFMETGDQVVAALPVSELSRPAPPGYNALDAEEEIYTFLRAGAGSYTSPEVQFWGAYPLNQNTYIGGDLDFSSSDGHLDDRPSGFRFLTANGEFGTRINKKMELRLYGGVQSDFNQTAVFDPDVPVTDDIRIEHEGFNGGAELSRFTNGVSGWKLQGNIRSFSTTFDNPDIGGVIDEVTYNGSFANRWALGSPNQTISLKAGGRGGSYDPQNSGSQTWGTLHGGAAYEQLFNYQTRLHAEAGVFYTSNALEDKVYPGGRLQVDHWFGERLKVTGKVEGKPHLNSVEELHERNRFLGYDNTLLHTYAVNVSGEAEIAYYRGSKLHGGVKYTNTKDHAYFLPLEDDQAGGRLDAYTVNYQNATNVKLFAGITHQLLPERFWVSGTFHIQNPELDDGNEIPFQENWGVNAGFTLRPIDRITIEGWADYVGERETGADNNTVDGFFLIGSQLDVEITDNFGGYFKLVNMLGQEYEVWQGYRERPFQVYGGLTLKF
jgi:hypothetical protein